jgi:hypothetical protein
MYAYVAQSLGKRLENRNFANSCKASKPKSLNISSTIIVIIICRAESRIPKVVLDSDQASEPLRFTLGAGELAVAVGRKTEERGVENIGTGNAYKLDNHSQGSVAVNRTNTAKDVPLADPRRLIWCCL